MTRLGLYCIFRNAPVKFRTKTETPQDLILLRSPGNPLDPFDLQLERPSLLVGYQKTDSVDLAGLKR